MPFRAFHPASCMHIPWCRTVVGESVNLIPSKWHKSTVHTLRRLGHMYNHLAEESFDIQAPREHVFGRLVLRLESSSTVNNPMLYFAVSYIYLTTPTTTWFIRQPLEGSIEAIANRYRRATRPDSHLHTGLGRFLTNQVQRSDRWARQCLR
jgi:hypothetical protein